MSSFSKYSFKIIFLSFTVIGTSMNLESVINFSDSMIFAMSIPNYWIILSIVTIKIRYIKIKGKLM